MTQATKALIRLAFLSVLWLLVRFTQFVLKLSELTYAACGGVTLSWICRSKTPYRHCLRGG